MEGAVVEEGQKKSKKGRNKGTHPNKEQFEALVPGRKREKAHHWLPDPFDPAQDIEDDVAVKTPFVPRADDCLIMLTCNLGDANRLLLYCVERYKSLTAVLELETVVGLRCESSAERSRVVKQFMTDVMLEKKCDRFYVVDRVREWSVDWAMQIVKESGLWDWPGARFRVMAAPRKLEQEFVVSVEDTCSWTKREPVPVFSPQGFTHCVSVVECTLEKQRKVVAWGICEADLVYLKPPTKNAIKEDKVSRAYFKLFEALLRFELELPRGGKGVDVGASPGGWTQCLVERGITVWAVDPAPLTLSAETMRSVVWLGGLSSSPAVEERLKKDGPFDVVVCDMNQVTKVLLLVVSLLTHLCFQMPDELARSFDNLVDLLVPNGVMVITIKLSHLRPEQRLIRRFSKGSNRLVKYFAERHPSLQFVGIKWLLQNKNERCVVFRKSL